MGTPDFAVPSLKKLYQAGFEISLVVTQEDKPVGRKQILTAPIVKQVAMELGVPVYQPKTLRTEEAQKRIQNENPDCIIVAAYGKILPKEVLSIPKYGCINIHGSLLPKYRGAAPIQRSVLNGDLETGVSIMKMDEGLDTGDVYVSVKRSITENATSEEMFDLLSEDGAELLVKSLPKIVSGELQPKPQEGESCYASMLSKEESWIDFSKSAQEVHNKVRGLYSWPIAQMMWLGKKAKVYSTRMGSTTNAKPGTVVSGNPLCIACGDGVLIEILEIQLEGSKRMKSKDFWSGHAIPLNTVIG